MSTQTPTSIGRSPRGAAEPLRILAVSSVFPSEAHPTYGVFVKERVRAVANLPGVELRVIAPTPYVPPISSLRSRYVWWKFPAEEVVDGVRVLRPRFPLVPKVGGFFSSELMYSTLARAATRLRREFRFELIDSHFAYPTGVAAVRLARRYGVPAVVTGRGEDMLRFPSLPLIGRKIRSAVSSRDVWCVALSGEIEEAFCRCGADPLRVTRIPNGVDLASFRPVDRDAARQALGLPPDRPVIVSVGNLQERKGFHLLVDALPALRRRFPDVLIVLVGGAAPYGDDYGAAVERRIRANDAAAHVRLVGRQPHGRLHLWYSAADAFALLSSREGSPNVLLEALACGVPAVATPAGGAAEELADPSLGVLLPERSAEAAAFGLADTLGRPWDRAGIRRTMEQRSWDGVARQVLEVFRAATRSAIRPTAAASTLGSFDS